jgi:predicted alpha/beta-fold hydrolase
MVVDTDGFTGGGPSSALVSELIGECEMNSFSGIVLDTGGRSSVPLPSLTVYLEAEAKSSGLRLYVPESLSSASNNTVILLPTALSGGTLSDHIGEALKKYGTDRVALEIERVRMDFSLPAVTGTGKELTAEELQALMEQHHAQSFLSKDLCAYYFTYHEKKGTRFVLYDNAASIRRKLAVGAKLGVTDAFIFYPHVADIIDKIIAP